jgi:tRNA-specific 2-thiouridylase
VNSYIAGETPNPCLACNRHIKFDKLKQFAQSLGASHLATGHYARVIEPEKTGDRFRLFEAVDPSKDQSYVLYNATQTGLAETMFPVGDKPKSEIRELARQFDLPNWDKEDSQEICFVPNKDYRSFIKGKIDIRSEAAPATTRQGYIKDSAGNVLGLHEGVAFYTVGQRKGLNLNSNIPMYVTRLEAATNTVVVGRDEEGCSAGLFANDINWIYGAPLDSEFSALVKIRYKHEPTPATVRVQNDGVQIRFDVPQRAVSPGQAAVFYRMDDKIGAREVIGGGKIVRAEN